MDKNQEIIKLTQYSHGAGCGCKISPQILDQILKTDSIRPFFPDLLVGNESKDDAAVFQIDENQAIISTTDFFMPIVDDAFDFGQIASANAISDVYAMGGKPIMAIAILGWPIDKLSAEVAKKVLEGSREICRQAGIPLAGGHSIDCPEPVFGLAVSGLVELKNLKQNNKASSNCLLFLSKPLGVGVLSTAQKKGIIKSGHEDLAKNQMVKLNNFGFELGKRSDVKALTDVTGFGLLGHLIEICEGSGVSAQLNFDKIPVIGEVFEYIEAGAIPGGTNRNWSSYGHKVKLKDEAWKNLLADPQTSGGLLIAVEAKSEAEFVNFSKKHGFDLISIGQTTERKDFVVEVV